MSEEKDDVILDVTGVTHPKDDALARLAAELRDRKPLFIDMPAVDDRKTALLRAFVDSMDNATKPETDVRPGIVVGTMNAPGGSMPTSGDIVDLVKILGPEGAKRYPEIAKFLLEPKPTPPTPEELLDACMKIGPAATAWGLKEIALDRAKNGNTSARSTTPNKPKR